MKTQGLAKYKGWIKLITFTVITSLLCQNIIWASGELYSSDKQKIEYKLSARSKVSEIVDEWNIISLVLAIYDMYGFKKERIVPGKIDTERIKNILRTKLYETGISGIDIYERDIERIKEVFFGDDNLIYIRYLINDNEEVLLRLSRENLKSSDDILVERSENIGNFYLQVVKEKGHEVSKQIIPDEDIFIQFIVLYNLLIKHHPEKSKEEIRQSLLGLFMDKRLIDIRLYNTELKGEDLKEKLEEDRKLLENALIENTKVSNAVYYPNEYVSGNPFQKIEFSFKTDNSDKKQRLFLYYPSCISENPKQLMGFNDVARSILSGIHESREIFFITERKHILFNHLKKSIKGLSAEEIRRLEYNYMFLAGLFDYETIAGQYDPNRISPFVIDRYKKYITLLLDHGFPSLKDLKIIFYREGINNGIRIFKDDPDRFLQFLTSSNPSEEQDEERINEKIPTTWSLEKSRYSLIFSVGLSLIITAILVFLFLPMENFRFMLTSPFASGASLLLMIIIKTVLYTYIFLTVIFPVNFTIINTLMMIIYGRRFNKDQKLNNRFYARMPLEKIEGMSLTENDYSSVTVMIPVHTESFSIIKKTIESAQRTISYYNQRHIEQANIIISDDALMIYTKNRLKDILDNYDKLAKSLRKSFYNNLSPEEKKAIDRVEFYRQNNIAFIARPMPDKRFPKSERKGTFKKGGNINFNLRQEELMQERKLEKGQEDNIAIYEAISDLLGDNLKNMAYAEGHIKIGSIIMQMDKDSLVDEKVIHYTSPEFSKDPTLAFTQHRSYPVNENNSSFTRTVGFFTRLLYDAAIPFKSFIGSHPPFMGHNGFIRTSILKKVGLWNENRATEDLHFTLQIASRGYHGKYISFEDANFYEYVTEDYEEEARKYTRYSYGMVEEMFERSTGNGLLKYNFRNWLFHPMIGLSHKFDLLVYFCSYLNIFAILPMLLLSTIFDVVSFHPIVIVFFILAFIQAYNMKRRKDVDKSFFEGRSLTFINLRQGLKIALMFYGFSRYIIEGVISFLFKLKPLFSPTAIDQKTFTFKKWIKRNSRSLKINLVLLGIFALSFIFVSPDPKALVLVCGPYIFLNIFVAYLIDPYLNALIKPLFRKLFTFKYLLILFLVGIMLFTPAAAAQQNGDSPPMDKNYTSEYTEELGEFDKNHPGVIFYLRLEQDLKMQEYFNYIYNTTFIPGLYNSANGSVDTKLVMMNLDFVMIIIDIVSSPNFNMEHHFELMPKVYAFLHFMKEASLYFQDDSEVNKNFALNTDMILYDFALNPAPNTVGFSFNLLGRNPNLDFNEWFKRMISSNLLSGRTEEGEANVISAFNELGDNRDDFIIILGGTPDGNYESLMGILRDIEYHPDGDLNETIRVSQLVREILKEKYGDNWRDLLPDQESINKLFDIAGSPDFDLEDYLSKIEKQTEQIPVPDKPKKAEKTKEEPAFKEIPKLEKPEKRNNIILEEQKTKFKPEKIKLPKYDSFLISVNKIRLAMLFIFFSILLIIKRRMWIRKRELNRKKISDFKIVLPGNREKHSASSNRTARDIGGKSAKLYHREKINPHLASWLKQNQDRNTIKVIDYYLEDGQWIPYKVEYKENYTVGINDKGELLDEDRYQLSDEEQKRLKEILQSCTYDKLEKSVRLRVVLDETTVAWRGDIDHSSLVHVGERTATIWFGEGLFRDLLKRSKDMLRDKVFWHERKHLFGNHSVDEGDEYEKLVREVYERCTQIEEQSISIKKAKIAFKNLVETVKKSNDLCGFNGNLGGIVQNMQRGIKLKFAIPVNVLQNLGDIIAGLQKLRLLARDGSVSFELIIYDIENDLEAEGFKRYTKEVFGVSQNVSIVTLTKAQMGGKTYPVEKIRAIKEIIKVKEKEYLAIATDMAKQIEADELKSRLKSELAQNTSIRIIVEPNQNSVISLSAILGDWLGEINNGNFSSINKILPVLISLQELRERLETQMKYAWEILKAA